MATSSELATLIWLPIATHRRSSLVISNLKVSVYSVNCAIDIEYHSNNHIIKALCKPGAKQSKVAQLFGISKSVVSRIKKNSRMI